MKSKLLHESNGLRTFALVFDKDDEVQELLLEFANTNHFADVHLSAIGAFSEVTLGFFERQKKSYKKIPIHEQVEVLAFTGDIVQREGKANASRARGSGQSRWHSARRTLSGRPRLAYAGNDCHGDARASSPHSRC